MSNISGINKIQGLKWFYAERTVQVLFNKFSMQFYDPTYSLISLPMRSSKCIKLALRGVML